VREQACLVSRSRPTIGLSPEHSEAVHESRIGSLIFRNGSPDMFSSERVQRVYGLAAMHTKTDRPQFADRLAKAVVARGTPVLVGLDPRVEQLPAPLAPSPGASWAERADSYRTFCRGVIDVVASLVPAVKPQAAFFEELGPAGMIALKDVCDHARSQGLIVIMDGKRNDIGSTASAYALGYLGSASESAWGADALTVSPYLGGDSLEPFVEVASARGCGVFVLVKTSNPGGGLFQDLVVDDLPIYRHVAQYVDELAMRTAGACGYGAIGAVAGATYPAQLAELREAMPHSWFLVPGYGSQGAGARDVQGAFDERGLGAVVNNSRGIIFAHARREYADKFGPRRWQEAVEAATRAMIDELRAETTAGKLQPGR
jgi:orotidine-5'-phosphate decarboxylase